MKHLDDGDLRRMLDEPEAFGDEARQHAQECEACRTRTAQLAGDARIASGAFAGDVNPDIARAYSQVRLRAAAPVALTALYRSLSAGALAAAFVLALLFTPLGGYARSFLTIFEPQHFQPIEISRADLQDLHLLPQADDVGTQHVVQKAVRRYYDSFAQAQQHAAFTLLRPSALPQGMASVHSYSSLTPSQMTFTFSAAKARAFEKRSHKPLPAMPPSLDGTTVRLQTGYVFNAHYEAPGRRSGARSHGTPFLEIVQAQQPRVTSSGASLDVLERYLLSMPNVSPQLAQQIRALGDIQNTVPVPVVIDKQTARPVSIAGAQGLAIGDNTGLGAGVMWQKNGVIYVVAGPVSMDDVMTVANGLR